MKQPAEKRRLSISDLTLYIGAVAIILIFTVACRLAGKDFLTVVNIQNIIKQSSVIAVTAIGASLVILTGGIDLSVGSVVAFVGIACGMMLKSGAAIPVVVCVALLIGAGFGLVSGSLISYGKVPAFIATLGMMNVGRGLALLINEGKPISGLSSDLKMLMNYKLAGIPISIVYVFVLYILIIVLMSYTRFGRHVYALGGNPSAAKLAGISIRRVEMTCYILAGVLSAVGGIMLLSRLSYADPNAGTGYEMNAIASAVIGGISLSGGRGKLANTLVGALILGALTSGLQILNISTYWQTIITGVVIIAAVYADKSKERRAE
ncbi:MAG: ABC transporter permease [Candidatus Limiplasma sp.]|nr:ABC transporter permease [Candidatus Limiplasma sp.]